MRITTHQIIRKGLIGIILVLACMGLGCSHLSREAKPTLPAESKQAKPTPPAESKQAKPTPPATKAQPPEKSAYLVHKIRWRGETLSIIAKWYTGDFKKWKALAKANPQINPNRLFCGKQLAIPTSLVKTKEPMPQEFVAKCTSKAK